VKVGAGIDPAHQVFINYERSTQMFSWALAFFIIAIIAAIFGFGGIAASAAGAATIVFVVALILAVVGLVVGRRGD
jgi:uncharacterized membrane protein YtjA (UPF0391 family)